MPEGGRLDRLRAGARGLPEGWPLWGLFWVSSLAVSAALAADFGLFRSESAAPSDTATIVEIDAPREGDNRRPFVPGTVPRPREAPSVEEAREPTPSVPPFAGAMRFRVAEIDGTRVGIAEGSIEAGSAARLERFLAGEGEEVAALYLFSTGGLVVEAMEMGRLLRAAEMPTRLSATGFCFSSCPLVFAGGSERSAAETGLLGLHQAYASDPTRLTVPAAFSSSQVLTGEIWDYLAEMGVDPAVWRHALATAPDEIYLLTPEELSETGFVGAASDR